MYSSGNSCCATVRVSEPYINRTPSGRRVSGGEVCLPNVTQPAFGDENNASARRHAVVERIKGAVVETSRASARS